MIVPPKYKSKNDKFNRDRYRLKLKIETLAKYGGKCACCGEDKEPFLTIDHIDGGGNTHRKAIKVAGGYGMNLWLKRNQYPPGFQALCFNCNLAKGFFGECPHARVLHGYIKRGTSSEMAFIKRGSGCRGAVAGEA